jgi:hypothetical protein
MFLPVLLLCLIPLPTSVPAAPAAAGSTLQITCPSTAKFFCGGSTLPGSTGVASATTTCPISPVVTIDYTDAPGPSTGCPADRYDVTLRTWTATDACGNTQSCVQELHTLRQIWDLDILPGSCPNTLGVHVGPAVVTIALTGAPGQNVADVIPGSVRIYTEQCQSGPVAPIGTSIADIARPTPGSVCLCQTLTGDSTPDLKLQFDRATLVDGLGLDALATGTTTRLIVTGMLQNGCPFLALDCVTIDNSGGNEGCSHGYWKNHLSAWGPTGFSPAQDFDTVFGVNAFTPNRTLLQALQAGGGGINNLGRQGVAALLDAAHPGVDFPLTAAQVITMVQDAVVNGTAGAVASQLDVLVNQGCPLN